VKAVKLAIRESDAQSQDRPERPTASVVFGVRRASRTGARALSACFQEGFERQASSSADVSIGSHRSMRIFQADARYRLHRARRMPRC
jgi:hypothetical protein